MASLDLSLEEKLCVYCATQKPLSEFSLTPVGNPRSRCKACRREQQNTYQTREKRLVREYGITQADYLELLSEQGGHCATCDRTPADCATGWLDIDHNHTTGEVRGLLCNSCNRGMGLAQDSVGRLEGWIKYLKERGSYGE